MQISMISSFENLYSNNPENREIRSVLEDIQNGLYKENILEIRSLIEQGNKEAADNKKKLLPCFTPSGTFKNGRKARDLAEYSRILVLDLDDLGSNLKEVKENACKVGFTYASFISPSGTGLKVLVKVGCAPAVHRDAFVQVVNHYEDILKVKVDPSGKDVNRLCFYSYDPETFINEHSAIFEVNPEPGGPAPAPDDLYNKALELTEKKYRFEIGNRNNFVHLLANNCNRYGILESEATALIKQRFNYDDGEVSRTIRSAYVHVEEHGSAVPSEDSPDDDQLLNTPTIPAEVYRQLPGLLRRGVSVFDTPRESDMYLIGALTVLSGCMDNVTGLYDQRTVYPNLYAFVVAPAASGKGAMAQAKSLGKRIHQEMLKDSEALMEEYEAKLKVFKKSKEEGATPPVKPKRKILFVPANSSSSAVIGHLHQSDSRAIMFETEADTLGNTFKQDWGGYSDLLRKAYHHEAITFSRKTLDEFIEVEQPQLSVLLSGTPSQVSNLIHSAEDGLFSRFTFYTFRIPPEWRDVSPKEGKHWEHTFTEMSEQVNGLYKTLLSREVNFELRPSQWEELNNTFDGWLQEMVSRMGEDAASSIKRLGMGVFRVAMILTVLRRYETGTLTENLICEDVDFNSALQMASVFKEHAAAVFSTLKGNKRKPGSKSMRRFLDSLPNEEFTRKDAVTVGERIGIKARAVDSFLKKLSPEYLTSPGHGVYRKTV